MSIDVRPVCPDDGSECVLQMEQVVDMVLDIDRSKRPRGMYEASGSMLRSLIKFRQPHPEASAHRGDSMRPIQALSSA